jgi:hypothetical protein
MPDPTRIRSAFLVEQGYSVEGDVLKNVVLLGPVSTNGHEYTPEAMQSAVPLYEGKAVYVDHDLKSKARRVGERFGHAENVRYVERDHDGRPRVRGDIPFLRSHSACEQVVEAYTKGRGYYGPSHVADGVITTRGGRKLVEQLKKVVSIDLVDGAATTTLIEQEDEGGAAPMDPAAHAQEGLISMITSIVLGEGTPADKGAKITALLETMEGGAAPAAAPAVPGAETEPPVSEQRLLAKVGELVEQKINAGLEKALPALIEQAVKDRAGGYKYLKPAGPGDPPPAVVAQPKTVPIPSEPKAKGAWLKSV